jgi:hypothetical protein
MASSSRVIKREHGNPFEENWPSMQAGNKEKQVEALIARSNDSQLPDDEGNESQTDTNKFASSLLFLIIPAI